NKAYAADGAGRADLVKDIQAQIDAGALKGKLEVSIDEDKISLTQVGVKNGEELAVTDDTSGAVAAVFGAGSEAKTGVGTSNAQFTLKLGAAEDAPVKTLTIDDGAYTTVESLADNINQQIAKDSDLAGKVRVNVDQGALQFVSTAKGSDQVITVGAVTNNGVVSEGLANLGFGDDASAAGAAAGRDANASVELIDISSIEGAQSAIATIDAALAEIDTTRAS